MGGGGVKTVWDFISQMGFYKKNKAFSLTGQAVCRCFTPLFCRVVALSPANTWFLLNK